MNRDLLAFLEGFRPDGYTTFVAIVPDGQTDAATFNGARAADTARWIERRNQHCGVYFTVNETPPNLHKKALKEDITAIGGFWSDLDPRDDQGLPIDHERERLAALAEELLALDTPPTLIIDSGSGMQPIWLLADPIEASPEYRDAADALCARFEAALGAKGTHNCDRVLRVPGTINHPNRKKRNFGRGETQARLLAATWQRYGWRDLEQLAARLENDPPAHAVPIVVDQRDGPRTGLRPEELDELRRSLTGHNPSGWLTAMLKMIGRLVHEGASDWFIKDWALQYRWPEYSEAQTLREIEPMIRGARKKGFDQKWDDQPSAAATAPPVGDALLDLSHDGLALHMGKRWAKNARHVALWGKWLFWSGSRWLVDEKLRHMTLTRDYLRKRADDLVRDTKSGKIRWGDKDPEQAVAAAEAIAKSLRAGPVIASVASLARSNAELVASVEQWDGDAFKLGTGTLTCQLRTGATTYPVPADYITKVTAVAPAPAGGVPHLWLSFLDRVTDGDKELQAYLRRAAGYCLTGSIREHVLFFLHGTGANGKSVFVNTLVGIWHDYAVTFPTELLMVANHDRHPTEIARLRGSRLAMGSEVEIGRTWAETRVKMFTGGDRLQGRFMRQDFFEFDAQFKLMIVGNNKPSLRGVDEAIRRRLHLIPFTVTIPAAKRDPDLPEKLKAEWPAIMRWCLDGCFEWQQIGLKPPERVLAATRDYLAGEDTFERWREDCTTSDAHSWESSGDLWASWQAWAGRTGEHPGKQRAFSQLLEERGLTPEKQGKASTRGYRGLRINRVDYTEDPRTGS